VRRTGLDQADVVQAGALQAGGDADAGAAAADDEDTVVGIGGGHG
jgi:hypothetical protein